jgi:hypothetical protein
MTKVNPCQYYYNNRKITSSGIIRKKKFQLLAQLTLEEEKFFRILLSSCDL